MTDTHVLFCTFIASLCFSFNYPLRRTTNGSRCSAPRMVPLKLRVLFCLLCCLPRVHPLYWQDPSFFDFRPSGKRHQTPSDLKMLHVLKCEEALLRRVYEGTGGMAQVIKHPLCTGLGGVAQVIKHPLCKHELLNLDPHH